MLCILYVLSAFLFIFLLLLFLARFSLGLNLTTSATLCMLISLFGNLFSVVLRLFGSVLTTATLFSRRSFLLFGLGFGCGLGVFLFVRVVVVPFVVILRGLICIVRFVLFLFLFQALSCKGGRKLV